MKSPLWSLPGAPLVLLAVMLVLVMNGRGGTLAAESDYEYAKALMERKEPSFSTDDLVERLIAHLEANAATKIDAKMIRATFWRRQAMDATPERKLALLKDSKSLFEEVTQAPKTYRLYDTAQKDLVTVRKEYLRALMNTKDIPPDVIKKIRLEAAELIEKEAAIHKAAADAAEPQFKDALAKYKSWMDKNNAGGDENKSPPREIIEPLDKAFDAWIVADVKYLLAKVEQLECYDESDAARKPLAEILTKLCEARVNDDNISGFPVPTARYYFIDGRIYAAMGDEEKAGKAWSDALGCGTGLTNEQQRRQIFALKKAILHDLVKLKIKNKKYGDVEEIILSARNEPQLKPIFDEDLGKELIVDYAKSIAAAAQTSDEYAKAIDELRDAIAKEKKDNKGASTVWSNEFSRAMAEILLDAREKKLSPNLGADEWYSAARGFFLMGQFKYAKYEKQFKEDAQKAKPLFEEAYTEFQNAVDYYRRAIAVARLGERTDLATRLNVEPKAWFEMGLSYLKMLHNYEAVIVYKAMRDTFLPENRDKWMPDRRRESRLYTKAVTDALAELDKPKEQGGLLAKSGSNILYALAQNKKTHRDSWNQALEGIILQGKGGGEIFESEGVKDKDYQIAVPDMETAKNLADNAKVETNPINAEDNYKQAVAKYLSAAEKLKAVKTTSEDYEFALIQIANCLAQAQEILASGKLTKDDPKETAARSKELAKNALAAYQKYEEFAAKTPATLEKDKARRKNIQGFLLLARNTLSCTLEDWETVVKSSNDYLAWEAAAQPQRSSAQIALLNKFRALYELSTTRIAPDCDPYITEAEAVMNKLHNNNPKDIKLYKFMLNALSRRNNVAAFQILDKKKKDPETDKAKREQMVYAYETKVADLQLKRVKLIEEDKDEDPTLEDYSRLVYLFNLIHQYKLAADMAQKMLSKFDPQDKNVRIADDEKVWQALLAKMEGTIKYGDLAKWDRCKKDHMVLVDYMYDTSEFVQYPGNDPKRPIFDKYPMDMEKAAEQLETIRKNYPDCQTFKVGDAKEGKSYLDMIEEEIDFRRKIDAARELLSNIALDVAADLEKQNLSDQAQEYWAIAEKQIEVLKKWKGETPAISIMLAEIQVRQKKYDEALETLWKVRNKEQTSSVIYFDASRRISEIYALQKKWQDAAEYPAFVATTFGFKSLLVKNRWPGLEEFLEECYKNNVPRPAALEKKSEEPAGETPPAPKPEDEKKESATPQDAEAAKTNAEQK